MVTRLAAHMLGRVTTRKVAAIRTLAALRMVARAARMPGFREVPGRMTVAVRMIIWVHPAPGSRRPRASGEPGLWSVAREPAPRSTVALWSVAGRSAALRAAAPWSTGTGTSAAMASAARAVAGPVRQAVGQGRCRWGRRAAGVSGMVAGRATARGVVVRVVAGHGAGGVVAVCAW